MYVYLSLRCTFFQSALVSANPITPASMTFAVVSVSVSFVGDEKMPFVLMKKNRSAVSLFSLCG